ncbi:uncharacterized protein TRIVIDRAFT_222752 [Trichoderma virens Gv29-8]|uniref:Uncharacterized protein n=1 Tax=Hypocrea virens (strain Gv29-8 / FGSC 10586) TaxID=413071 RepID=G9MUW7_HYPVG|nr:uncharacterized protein TRIVIDRAFT_222752 [Trichoderma virens Gv29-8]EHK21782.1 hypothetical protein TRIVIDRAFT_222752 [Trichoderma virens Gv29-8]UKZ51048.1 hypothetical protein TrVGV298_004803 [Trichoderma virens]
MADIGTGGFLAVGNKAPWGLPDSCFRPSSQANATGLFSIPAFNLSSSNESLEGDGHKWNIEISLQANIPLNGSTDKSLSAAQKEEFTQFVSMSLNNVEKTEVEKVAGVNRVCGYIFSGLNINATADNQDDASKGGNCGFFSRQCREDLQSAVQQQATDCGSATVPDSCRDWLGLSPSGNQVLQVVSFEFNEKLLAGSRFFTFGFPPASENNETEYDTAVRNIWPVLFTWSHASGTSDNITMAASTLRCLRPSNVTSGSRDPNESSKGSNGDKGSSDHPGAAGTNSVPTLAATLLLTAFASCLIFL